MAEKRLEARVGADISEFSRKMGQLAGQAEKTAKASEKAFSDAGKKIGLAFKGAAGVAGAALGALGLGFLAKDIAQTSMGLESVRNTLKAVTGSSAEAGKQFGFVRSESNRLGIDLIATGQAYARLAASSKGTAIEGKATQDIFSAVAEATTVLGLSTDDTNGALLALGQMMSKGSIQAEELRGQLGERIPGAFQAMAKAAGVSTEELNKMLEQGKVGIELLPKFAEELRKMYAQGVPDALNSSRAALGRLSNAWTEFKEKFASAGFMDELTKAVKRLTDRLTDPSTLEAVDTLGRLAGKGIDWSVRGAGQAIGFFEYLFNVISRGWTALRENIMATPGDIRNFIINPFQFSKQAFTPFFTPGGGVEMPSVREGERQREAVEAILQKRAEAFVRDPWGFLGKVRQEKAPLPTPPPPDLEKLKKQVLEASHYIDAVFSDAAKSLAEMQQQEYQAAFESNNLYFNFLDEQLQKENENNDKRLKNYLAYLEETGNERLAKELQLEKDRQDALGELQERFIMGGIRSWDDYERERAEISETFASRLRRVQENAISEVNRQVTEQRSIWRRALDWITSAVPEAGRRIKDSAVEMLSGIKSAASDLLFDFFTGELKSLADAFQKTFRFILRVVTDILAEIVVQAAIKTNAIKVVIAALSRAIDRILGTKEKEVIIETRRTFDSLTLSILGTTAAVWGLKASLASLGCGGGGPGGWGDGGGGDIGSILGGGGGPGGWGGGDIGSILGSGGRGLGVLGRAIPGGLGRFLGASGVVLGGAGLGYLGGSLLGRALGLGPRGQSVLGGAGAGGIGGGLAAIALGASPLVAGLVAIGSAIVGGGLGSLFGPKRPKTSREERYGSWLREAQAKPTVSQRFRRFTEALAIGQYSPRIQTAFRAAGAGDWYFSLFRTLYDAVGMQEPGMAGNMSNLRVLELEKIKALSTKTAGFRYGAAGGDAYIVRWTVDVLNDLLRRTPKVSPEQVELARQTQQGVREARILVRQSPPGHRLSRRSDMELGARQDILGERRRAYRSANFEFLASGGITTGTRPVLTMLSETPGLREAVIPLNPQTLRMLRREGLGGGGPTINLTAEIHVHALDPESAERIDWRDLTRRKILPQVQEVLAVRGIPLGRKLEAY